jgi:large subunit ribosomal protein L34
MSVTFKLKRKKRNRKHGFLKRMSTKDGRKIINNRRRVKRKRLVVHADF